MNFLLFYSKAKGNKTFFLRFILLFLFLYFLLLFLYLLLSRLKWWLHWWSLKQFTGMRKHSYIWVFIVLWLLGCLLSRLVWVARWLIKLVRRVYRGLHINVYRTSFSFLSFYIYFLFKKLENLLKLSFPRF